MDNIFSTFFYIIIIIIACLFALLSQINLSKVKQTEGTLNKKYNLFFVIMSYLTLTIPVAFRYYTGADYTSYVYIYNTIKSFGMTAANVEIGYAVLNYLCILIFDDYQSVFIIMAILTNYFFFKGILYEANKHKISLGIAIFVYGFTLYFWGYIIIRNILGIAIIFYALKFIFERKLWIYFIRVTFAMLFHYSLVIFYILGLLYIEKFKKVRILIILISIIAIPFIPIIISFIGSTFINYVPRFTAYKTYLSDVSVSLDLLSIFSILPIIAFAIYYKKMDKINANTSLYFSFYVLSIILSLYSSSMPLITRYIYAFWPAQIILFATFIRLFDKNLYAKVLVSGVIFVFGLILIINFINVDLYYLLPYKSVLQR